MPGPRSRNCFPGLAIGVTGIPVATLANSESAVGFKQHILRESDANKNTAIVLQKNAVRFRSPSGTSPTGVSKVDSGQVNALLRQLGATA